MKWRFEIPDTNIPDCIFIKENLVPQVATKIIVSGVVIY